MIRRRNPHRVYLTVISCILFILLSAGLSPAARADPADPWWSADKGLHLGISAALAGTTYGVLWLADHDPLPVRAALSAGLALLPGLAKELYDAGQRGNHFSGKDLLWDAAGVTAAVALGVGLELLLTRQPGQARARVRLGPGSLWLVGRF